jgi:hypothetical protein
MEARCVSINARGETLTSFLELLETAVNELQDNLPEKVTPALIYYIFCGSLNDQVRETLEKAHLFTNRARELSVEEKLRFWNGCENNKGPRSRRRRSRRRQAQSRQQRKQRASHGVD